MDMTANNRLSRFSRLQARSQQQGAVLVVAIVILLAMTIVGVSSRVSTGLQQKLNIAYQQKLVANMAAESALRAAETWLTLNVNNTTRLSQFAAGAGNLGLYSNYTMVGEINATNPVSGSLADVSSPSSWTNANSVAVNNYDVTAALPPRYVIEYVGRDKGTANKVVIDYNDPNAGADTSPHVFQITAIGWSRDQRIYQVLQSTYRTGRGPGNFTY